MKVKRPDKQIELAKIKKLITLFLKEAKNKKHQLYKQLHYCNKIDSYAGLTLAKLAEDIAPILSSLKVVDETGYDFNDKSEMKTATTCRDKTSGNIIATISNIKHKFGKIRIIIYVPEFDELIFLVIPSEAYANCRVKIMINIYDKDNNYLSNRKYLNYRVNTLSELYS